MDDLALLRLQMEWGADEALEEAPVDRLRPPPVAKPPPAPRCAGPLPNGPRNWSERRSNGRSGRRPRRTRWRS